MEGSQAPQGASTSIGPGVVNPTPDPGPMANVPVGNPPPVGPAATSQPQVQQPVPEYAAPVESILQLEMQDMKARLDKALKQHRTMTMLVAGIALVFIVVLAEKAKGHLPKPPTAPTMPGVS